MLIGRIPTTDAGFATKTQRQSNIYLPAVVDYEYPCTCMSLIMLLPLWSTTNSQCRNRRKFSQCTKTKTLNCGGIPKSQQNHHSPTTNQTWYSGVWKKVFVIVVVVGLDVNVEKNYETKLDNYFPLCIGLKKTIPWIHIEVIPVAIGPTGLVTKQLSTDLEKIGIERSRTGKSIVLAQKAALFGSVKIIKSAMNY